MEEEGDQCSITGGILITLADSQQLLDVVYWDWFQDLSWLLWRSHPIEGVHSDLTFTHEEVDERAQGTIDWPTHGESGLVSPQVGHYRPVPPLTFTLSYPCRLLRGKARG
jgi:hypothetical protein